MEETMNETASEPVDTGRLPDKEDPCVRSDRRINPVAPGGEEDSDEDHIVRSVN
jgi:hypothetical protein